MPGAFQVVSGVALSLAGHSLLTSSPGSNFHINLLFDDSTASAPSGFFTQIIQAAQFLDATLANDITVNITVGWGEVGGDNLPSDQVVAASFPSEWTLPYDAVAAYLSNAATSAADFASVAHLPANDPLGQPAGTSDWAISSAQFRVFDPAGFPTDPQIDGAIGYSTAWTSDWLGAALHELTHALGRVSDSGDNSSPGNPYDPTVFDLFRYGSAGHLKLKDGAAYFSIDGGATRLANFGVQSDSSDFLNDHLTPHDPFDEFVSGDAWTALDSTTMDVLGFTLSASAPPSPTTLAPDLTVKSFAFDGQTASWKVSDAGGVALPTITGLYLSTDKTITTADTLLGAVDTPGLKAGASASESLGVSLPGDLAAGTYYLGALANQVGDVNESKIANDASSVVGVLVGGAGADALQASSTVSVLFGGAGDDVLTAGSGSAVLDGGDGTDRAVLGGAFASYKLTPTGGGYTAKSSTATDTLHNIEIAQFSDRQMVLGGAGETLTARATKDTLVGGSGDDTLIASPGKDTLTGGGGHDHFVFGSIQDLKVTAPDQITDFVSGQDQIDISALNALLSGGGSFHLGATSGHTGDVTLSYDATHGRTVVSVFTNGDNQPDGVLWLTGHHTGLTTGDFVL